MEQEILNELSEIKSLIKELDNNSSEVLNFEQAKKFLNFSGSYLYKLTSQNLIPCYKPRGKQLYFNKSELQSWLLQNRNTTSDEIEKQASDYIISKG